MIAVAVVLPVDLLIVLVLAHVLRERIVNVLLLAIPRVDLDLLLVLAPALVRERIWDWSFNPTVLNNLSI